MPSIMYKALTLIHVMASASAKAWRVAVLEREEHSSIAKCGMCLPMMANAQKQK